MWDSFLYLLKFLGYELMLLAVVPLAGLCVTGSWRHAWAYTKIWLRTVGFMVLAAAVVFIVVMQVVPNPG